MGGSVMGLLVMKQVLALVAIAVATVLIILSDRRFFYPEDISLFQPSSFLVSKTSLGACDIAKIPLKDKCDYIKSNIEVCDVQDGLFPYLKLHACELNGLGWLSTIIILLWVTFLFSMLFFAVKDFFCPALGVICDFLGLSPDIAGATLLAFGNGSPDVFTQLAAARKLTPVTVPLAITEPLGGGLFVSNITVAVIVFLSGAGGVALQRAAFARDSIFYLGALLIVGLIIMDGKITTWEACSLLGYYCLFVLYLILSQKFLGVKAEEEDEDEGESEMAEPLIQDQEQGETAEIQPADSKATSVLTAIPQTILQATMPQINQDGTLPPPHTVALIPLLFPMFFALAQGWIIPLVTSSYFAFTCGTCLLSCLLLWAAYPRGAEAQGGWLHGVFTVMTFVQCVIWVMFSTGEAVAALQALGYQYGVSQVILGATVLAWGNSLADTVSDPAMALAGYPAMGVAAAFASPLFTLVVGLGSVFLTKTIQFGEAVVIGQNYALYTAAVFAIVNMARYAIGAPSFLKWRLTKATAVFNILLYASFSVLYCLYSLEILAWPWNIILGDKQAVEIVQK